MRKFALMILRQKGYRRLRAARIIISVGIMLVMAGAVAFGYTTFLWKWQLTGAILTGTGAWLLLWAVVTSVAGRLYCSTACPLGTLQDFLARMRRRRNGYFYSAPAQGIRRMFVIVMIVAAVLGMATVVTALNPSDGFERMARTASMPWARGVAFSLGTMVAAAVTLAVCAGMAVWRGRLLCNTLCPLGTVLGAFSRMALFQIDINTDVCVGCGKCTASCKAQCIDPSAHTVDFSRCVVCFDCMANCPTDAIAMRRRRHQLQWPMLQSVETAAAVKGMTASADNCNHNAHSKNTGVEKKS